ncbi:MAG: ATP-binding protein [Janthinobacterium lividum]
MTQPTITHTSSSSERSDSFQTSGMSAITFSVDAALLRELGERLVGKPYIALAELVKNSYDADATSVVIEFGNDQISISDNGHGMTVQDFRHFWMRVGSPHKQLQRVSKGFNRPLTGSKGVGRLAVQFLAHRLEMVTIYKESTEELVAKVDWDETIIAGELTKAKAFYTTRKRQTELLARSKHGTKFILSGLKQKWDVEAFKELAREIWPLQPPFRGNTQNPADEYDEQKAFRVVLKSSNREEVDTFDNQMKGFLGLYHARIIGRLIKSSGDESHGTPLVKLNLNYREGANYSQTYPLQGEHLEQLTFEIRVYYLNRRQQFGISVEDARNYLRDFGGVHVYDAGFHLPYYGIETDWLGIEVDHSHRIKNSKLLPVDLQDKGSEGIRFLPTNNRLFGVVRINTARERIAGEARKDEPEEYLAIQMTRDRLVDNKAFETLRKTVRWALDFYAVQEARRSAEAKRIIQPTEVVPKSFQQVTTMLEDYRNDIPEPVFQKLHQRIEEAVEARVAEAEAVAGQVGLLGALATAGISAIAYEHEVSKQFQIVDGIASQLAKINAHDTKASERLSELATQLHSCVSSAHATRALFSHLMDEENREMRQRFRARPLVKQVVEQMGILLRGIEVNTSGIDPDLRLPEAGFAEWSAILQNVVLNAVNAMLDAPARCLSISSNASGHERSLLMEDTGSGVHLSSAEELFKPFVRKLKLSHERQSLGLGGTGLGLTIVKMIANNIPTNVAFVKPRPGFNTAFQISWRETT